MNLCVLLNKSVLFSLNQINLHKGDMGCMGVPVVRYICSPCGDDLILWAIASLRTSAQVIMGFRAFPLSSTLIRLCMALLRLIADGGVPVFLTISCTQSTKACHIVSGS